MRYWIALMLALTLNAAANLMMKVGARRAATGPALASQSAGDLLGLVQAHWILLMGLCFFAINVLFYTYALSSKDMKISVAYPIMVSGGFAIIALVAWKFLGETLSAPQWLGITMILCGVYLVAREIKPVSG